MAGHECRQCVNCSLIVIVLSACWLISLALALIPPGMGYGGSTIGMGMNVTLGYACWVPTRGDHCFSVGVLMSEGMTLGDTRVIAGTVPGVLLCA